MGRYDQEHMTYTGAKKKYPRRWAAFKTCATGQSFLARCLIQTETLPAIELHSRAIEELSVRRWWVPVLAAFLGFVGAIIGAIIAAFWGDVRLTNNKVWY
jgi:hypothetical protein